MKDMKPTQGVMINVPDDVNRFTSSNGDANGVIIDMYKSIFNDIKTDIQNLALLEEVILQERCINSDLNIKLSILREYVYARCPFYRMGKSTKDIRVIVSRIDIIYPDHVPTLDELYNDQDFMIKAKDKLVNAMIEEHNVTVATALQVVNV